MFCCLLLHKDAPDEPVVTSKCNLEYVCVGLVLKGTAGMEFDIPKTMKSVVLYIPTLLQQPSGARSRVRVTKCLLQERKDSEVVRSDVFQLSRNSTASTQVSIPSYSQVKSRCTKAVLAYGGAQSPYDCIFYIGDIKKGSQLLATVEFVSNIEPTTVSTEPQYSCLFLGLFPCEHLVMKTTLYASGAIQSVAPMDTEMSQIEVNHHSTNQCTVLLTSHTDSPRSKVGKHGFCLKLASDSLFGSCFTALLTNPLSIYLPSGERFRTFDGVLMGNIMYTGTPDTVTTSSSSSPSLPVLVPSEFVFVVDCSGSMSGLKIQSASESLILAIKSLPIGCHFNVIAFGSKYRTLFHSSVELTEKTMGRAIQFANHLQPYLGGTELLSPLSWILKQPPRGSLPRQIFLITDGGVPNVRVVLEAVSRHGRNTRFHTFALGPDICSELMAELAAMTGGQCLVIEEEDRLQSKVIGTLKASLQPALLKASVNWTPPPGYSIVDSIPRSFDTVYPNVAYSAFAVLQKNQGSSCLGNPCPVSKATLSGKLAGCERSFAVSNCAVFQTRGDDIADSAFIEAMLKACAWLKIHSLEEECLRFRPNKTVSDEETAGCEPLPKKPRLNGTSSSPVPSPPVRSLRRLREELQAYSLYSGVPCSLARHQAVGASGMCHMTPLPALAHQHNHSHAAASPSMRKKASQKSMRAGQKRTASGASASSFLSSISLSSIARCTVSTVSSAAKTAANIASFGLLSFDEPDVSIEAGERIEDQLYYQNKKDRLHWDDQHQLVYPKFYFTNCNDGSLSTSSPESGESQLPNGQSASISPPSECHEFSNPDANGSMVENPPQSTTQGNEEAFLSLSKRSSSGGVCESMSSDSTRIPCSFIPLVEMQLVSGAWPLVQPILCATGVSLETVQNLLVPPDRTHRNHFHGSNGINSSTRFSSSSEGNVWATAIAIACLQEHYSQFKSEWELVALKGELWLSKHCKSPSDVLIHARDLVCKQPL